MYGTLMAAAVFLPILGGFVLFLLNSWIRRGGHEKLMELLIEVLVVVNSLLVAWVIIGTGGRSESLVLFRLYGQLTVSFKLDLMGSVFAGLVAFLWPLATLYAFEYMEHENRRPAFFGFYTITYGVTLGVALAGNLVTMYLFYEMLTFVTFPLVLYPMTREAARASRQYLYYSIGGAAFAFLGLVFVLEFSAIGTTEFVPGGMLDLAAAAGKENQLLLIYVLAFFGFGVKAAIFPCHGWLPKAAVAPTPVTALLHAVAVVKSGAFAVLRFTYFNYGIQFLRGTWAQWVVMAAALITIAYASTMGVKEIHWKRRLAYSTISNLSYILFGAAVLSPLGLAAALVHLVCHAFTKICAFFCAGAVMHKTGKTHIHELDGIGRQMPVTFFCFTVSSLSLMGVPLFAGFISKWNLCQAAFALGRETLSGIGAALPYAAVAVILYSALMTGVYMMTVVVRAYFPGGKSAPADSGHPGDTQAAEAEAVSAQAVSTETAEAGTERKPVPAGGNLDPGWRMLIPLVIFVIAIMVIGMHSVPLMNILTAIGGEAG